MARTSREIEQSLVESLRTTDPSVDTLKGPIYDFLLRPVPTELQKTEADAERISILATLQLGSVISKAEAEAMATSFSIRLGGGKASKTKRQIFFTLTKPIKDILINRGNLVGTDDQKYTYFVSEQATIPASSADNFYSPRTRRYEIAVKCEATSVGPAFDLPPQRVRKLITRIDGIDGTYNQVEYAGGEEAEDLAGSIDRIRAKFSGLDPETGGGIISDIRNFDAENVKDVSLVYPKDRALFKRGGNRPAVDAYVLGEQVDTVEHIYTATGGETRIMLPSLPVRGVTSVLTNGIPTDFSFIQDTSLESGFSPRSGDFILLNSPLMENDVVAVTYDYNALVQDLQNDLFALERPFDTDVLVREARKSLIHIELSASAMASFDSARFYDAIESKLFEIIETPYFIDVLEPEIVRQKLRDEVGGFSTLRLTKFKRVYGSYSDVESIDLQKNEVPVIDQARLKINVRR
jgi:hypothetical protein